MLPKLLSVVMDNAKHLHLYKDKENINPQDCKLDFEENNISTKISKKDTPQYANNIQSIRQENKLLKKEIKSQKGQLQALAVGIEQQHEKNQKLQKEKVLFQKQLQSFGDNCWHDDNLMTKLCEKLEINSDYSYNLNGLINFVSDYNEIKQKLSHKTQETQRYKKEIESFENKHFEKGDILHIESLRGENENLRKEICILEESNTKLATDLIKKSEKTMKEIQATYNKKNKEYEKQIVKIKREKKVYRHKCQHFQKETKGFATKYEELTKKHSELRFNCGQSQSQSDNNDTLRQENIKLTNELDTVNTNSQELKSTNSAMHSQIAHFKKAYSELHNKHEITSKKYEILKQDWERLNQDRSNAMEKVCESENKFSTLQLTIAQLNQENKKEDGVVEEEIHLLKLENSNLKQAQEKQMYDIEDLENTDKQIRKELNEWKVKYEDINNKYEFEAAQHDNTLKKLNDLRAVWDGETNLSQMLQVKQQIILELQSKINELKTMTNVDVSMEEYKHFQQELNVFNELQNKYQLSTNQSTHVQMEELVTYLHKTEDEYTNIKQENTSLNNIIQELKNNKITLSNSLKDVQNKLKVTQQCNVKLRDEVYAFSSAADLVQEQLKTSAVALSSTTDKKQKLIQEIDHLRQQINNLQNENYNLQNSNDELLQNANKSDSIEMPKLLDSYNNLCVENEQLQADNQALYQQLQMKQINKYIQSNEMDNVEKKTNEINLQSLVKKGKLLAEQCADLHVENRQLTQKVSELQQQILVLDKNKNKNMNGGSIGSNHHEAVSKELRHRNEQLLNQLRSLQQDIQTDTELINTLHKENGELRTKIKTLLQQQNDEPQKIVAVDGKSEQWQEIINGLRKQLQEARGQITELCEELQNQRTQQAKEIKSDNNYSGQIAEQYAQNEELCEHMQSMIQRLMTEQKAKEELLEKFNELQNNLVKTKRQLMEIEESKTQLSHHNQQLAKEISNLQSLNQQFEHERQQIVRLFAGNNNQETLDIKHEIECLLNKNNELQDNIDQNAKQYLMETDFNAKCEEIKRLLIERNNAMTDSSESDPDTCILNKSVQHMEEIMNTHKLMKYDKLQKEYNTLSQDMNKKTIQLNEFKDKLREYKDKIGKMNEVVTKLSSVRSKLSSEKQKLENKLKIADKKNAEFDRKIESALKQKISVDKELSQLQSLHNNKAQNLEDLLHKYQQSVQENEIIKISKEQHEMLIKQIEHLHKQLTQSRQEYQQLREKAQLHYLKRKEEWKKLKQFENKSNSKEINSLCHSINNIIKKLKNIDTDNKQDDNNINQYSYSYSFANISSFLQTTLVSLRFYLSTNDKKQAENENIEFQELLDKFKLIQQQNHSLKSQIRRNTNDLQELEEQNKNLRDIENEEIKLKQLISTLQTEKASLSKTNNQLNDGNVNLEEQNKKSQQEIGKFQMKAERLKQQRDYAKSKYKELKTKFTFLEQQFRNLQSPNNINSQQATSQSLPFES